MTVAQPWWRSAVTYQLYIRSFADSNGDGIGDIQGITSRIPYLKSLGIDAIWVTPWYPSPRIDNGYDVMNFMEIAPEYGQLEDAKRLIDALHSANLKLIVDIVPNHSSDQHEWFQEALRSEPNSPARDRYLFRDGKGMSGELPPNNWESIFGGPAWTRVIDSDGFPEQWYCHIFAPEQPDFNWESSTVRNHFEDVLRFWLDMGVDGFRIDVAHGLIKAFGLPDAPTQERLGMLESRAFPFWDQEGVHDIYRRWRNITDSYPGDKVTVAEAWVNPPSRVARYARPGELCTVFNFDFMSCRWNAQELRESIDRSIDGLAEVGAPATWVLNNH
ncbi:MAG TPA: alpha-amylase family glycosyl hydrolase, partial [Candidatus Nanopelagicaceae bacterium]|nr:alpha-amylase family glycosyl hydrolase [Candidatus Nanopelagicaceae bacterium]